MSDADVDADDLILPDTLAETRAMLSGSIGEITELRAWIALQYQGRNNGLRIDWDDIRAANEKIAQIQGDIKALRAHASGFREDLQSNATIAAAEKARLKLDVLSKQKEIERQAQEAKRDKTVAAAQLEERRERAALGAVIAYIKESAPDHFPTIRAIVAAARGATK